jgi:hypothetical protein
MASCAVSGSRIIETWLPFLVTVSVLPAVDRAVFKADCAVFAEALVEYVQSTLSLYHAIRKASQAAQMDSCEAVSFHSYSNLEVILIITSYSYGCNFIENKWHASNNASS